MKKGEVMSLEQKQKLSEAHKGKPAWNKGKVGWNKGHIVSEETRKKISEGHKGKIFSEEHKKHISDNHRTKRGFSSPNKGKHYSEETKTKMSKITKELWGNPEYREKIKKANREFVINVKNAKKCQYCGKEYIDKTKNNEKKFCSDKCGNKAHENNPLRKIKLKEYRIKNKEKLYLKSKIWASTPYGKEAIRKSRIKHKETRVIYNKSPKGRLIRQFVKHRRRGKERELFHNYSKSEWLAKVKLLNGICPICKNPFDSSLHKLSLDHNPPIAKAPKGFVYTINDVIPICSLCNSKKGAR